MSDGTEVEIEVEKVPSGKWKVCIGMTRLETFSTKEEAIKWAKQYCKDMKESEGTKGKVVVIE